MDGLSLAAAARASADRHGGGLAAAAAAARAAPSTVDSFVTARSCEGGASSAHGGEASLGLTPLAMLALSSATRDAPGGGGGGAAARLLLRVFTARRTKLLGQLDLAADVAAVDRRVAGPAAAADDVDRRLGWRLVLSSGEALAWRALSEDDAARWVEALAGLHEVRARRARSASAARTHATDSRAPLATRSLRPHSARARWSRPTRRWSRPTRRRLRFDVKILSEKPRDPN